MARPPGSGASRASSAVCSCRRRCWRSTPWRPAVARGSASMACGCRWGRNRPARIQAPPVTAAVARSRSPTPTCCWGACSLLRCRRSSAPAAISALIRCRRGWASSSWPVCWGLPRLMLAVRVQRRGRLRCHRPNRWQTGPWRLRWSGWPRRSGASRSSRGAICVMPCSAASVVPAVSTPAPWPRPWGWSGCCCIRWLVCFPPMASAWRMRWS